MDHDHSPQKEEKPPAVPTGGERPPAEEPTPPDIRAICPVCGAKLVQIQAKLVCSKCHTICETCCEGERE
ncbi:MAG: hypothetical protein HYS13_06280 [Planctomycetia bacterium]|nr:hypothetical protein [Planctomycetia bacterium]